MKTSLIIIIIVIFVLVGIFIYQDKQVSVDTNDNIPTTTEVSVVGCYAMRGDQDVYTLKISFQDGINVTGTLAFKNFQKDSSSGTLVGTYSNGILVGDYSFASEGMNSVMQVAFKKINNNFIRGYGDVDSTGTRFVDMTDVIYDSSLPLSVFKSEPCI